MNNLVEIKDGQIIANQNAVDKIIEFKKTMDEMELLKKSFENALKDKMEELGIENFTIGNLKASIRKATTRKTVDTKRMKEEIPDIYEEYLKTSDVASSITLKIEEGK